MDPNVIGYGVPAGGRIEIELAGGFERDGDVPLTQKAIMVVTGAPQQGMPGKAVGYKVGQGKNANTITITPTKAGGLPAESLLSPAKGAKGDPVRQRGIKVFHVGFRQSAFINRGASGTAHVRFIDGTGKVVNSGSASVAFFGKARPTDPSKQFSQQTAQSQLASRTAGADRRPGRRYRTDPDYADCSGQGGGAGRDVLLKMRASLARPRFPQARLCRQARWDLASDGRWRASVRSFCGFCVTSRCNFCRASWA